MVTREPEPTVGGVHGGHGVVRAEAGGSVARKEEDSGESCGGGRPESNTWGRREAGGGAGLQRRRAAVKLGSGRRQVRRGEGRGGQRVVGEGSGEAGKGTWPGAGRR
jgi:hypothetical protein